MSDLNIGKFKYKGYKYDPERTQNLFKQFQKNRPVTVETYNKDIKELRAAIQRDTLLNEIIVPNKQEDFKLLEQILYDNGLINKEMSKWEGTTIDFTRFFSFLKEKFFLVTQGLENKNSGIIKLAKLYSVVSTSQFKLSKRKEDLKTKSYKSFVFKFNQLETLKSQ